MSADNASYSSMSRLDALVFVGHKLDALPILSYYLLDKMRLITLLLNVENVCIAKVTLHCTVAA